MKVLVACEFSEIVKEQFLNRGHDAHSCDLLPGEKGLKNHHQADVISLLGEGWDLMIAHPPCTYLCNSGVMWLHVREGRWEKMVKAAKFFRQLLDAPIPRICVENPIMHKYAVQIIGRRQNQVVQPYMFKHGEKKATCFWLKNLPNLVPTGIVEGRFQRLHRLPPSADRWKERSRTYTGIAEAMANQWGQLDTSLPPNPKGSGIREEIL